jgi:hypothetical protein
LFIFMSRDSGCPMPPAAPSTATRLHSTTGMTRAARTADRGCASLATLAPLKLLD